VCGLLLAKSGHVVVSGDERPTFIVESGTFRYVRHPLYLASLLFYLARAIATMSLISFALFVVICVFYDYIAGYEERLMLSKFGDAYRDYMKRTGKWFPRAGAR
jgi:protein-S-isoprenylcysteine O-methyltransferase Ste14